MTSIGPSPFTSYRLRSYILSLSDVFDTRNGKINYLRDGKSGGQGNGTKHAGSESLVQSKVGAQMKGDTSGFSAYFMSCVYELREKGNMNDSDNVPLERKTFPKD
jgi:hypothetical protein